MKDLIHILEWCRGAGSQTESLFVQKFIATLPGVWPDEYGNYHLTIGDKPKVLWSCHTDTVTRKEGKQNVRWLGKGIIGLNNPQPGQCLGADDGAGLWIMLELIKAKKEGHYVFHRDEEIGGLGSDWIKKNAYVLPEGLMCAIAMDRVGTQDIITHQGFQRTASDEFGNSLAAQLPKGMRNDDGGTFTDTANYVDLIGECTNLAVGYERNHGKDETLDTKHVKALRDALLVLDVGKLEFVRQPGDEEYINWGGGYYGGSANAYRYDDNKKQLVPLHDDDEVWQNYMHGEDDSPLDRGTGMGMIDMVNEAPGVAARLITELGVSEDEFRAHVYALTGRLLGN